MPAPSLKPTTPVNFDRDPTRSRTLPGIYYFDPEIFDLEKRKSSIALAICRPCLDVARAGQLHRPQHLDQSVLLLRDRDGEIRAFFNVCQHRAHQLLKGEGRLSVGGHHLSLSRLDL